MVAQRPFKVAAGMIVAPWLFIAGTAAKSPALLRLALACDRRYGRAEAQGATRWGGQGIVEQLRIATTLASLSTEQAAKQLKTHLPRSESQILQDLFCFLVLDEKRAGYFVEVGVGNGTSISNTYMLERDFGWNGLLVEPNRSFHESIRASRRARLDIRAASAQSRQTLMFQEVVGAGEYSGLSGSKEHSGRGEGMLEYSVDTETLTEILRANNAPSEIDYLSVDTEGNELDILRAIDFATYRFKVLTIEHNFDWDRLKMIEALLRPHGYRRVLAHVSSFDAWFLHKDVSSGKMPGLM